MYMYKNNVRIARKIAIGTIISGLIFLGAYYLTTDISYAYGGMFFGLGVATIVLTILVSGLIASKRQNHKPNEKGIHLFWNFLSLFAIAIFTVVGVQLMNGSRIKIENNTAEVVKNIFITGCQNFKVEDIQPNDSKTIFVNYFNNENQDCAIGIRFTTATQFGEEILITEAKPFKGEKINYEIN